VVARRIASSSSDDAEREMNLWKGIRAAVGRCSSREADDAQGDENWSPDGKWIEYAGGSRRGEIFDLYAVPASGGRSDQISRRPRGQRDGCHVSRDGTFLAYSARAKEASTTNIAVLTGNSTRPC